MGIYRLTPTVKNYAWGKKGKDSIVARLFGDPVSEDLRYAELWMGAHISSPSMIEVKGEKRFLEPIDFLFKILSIASPLSIQLHPDKALAKKLHQQNPENYPDTNHKPEIAVALSQVDLLYGFRPLEEVLELAEKKTALRSIIGEDILNNSPTIESLYKKVMGEEIETAKSSCRDLYLQATEDTPEDRWIRKIKQIYPEGDIGAFSFYLLNLASLSPGEAVYSLPFVPHAYLSGDLVECMANSDNTIRAGLTSKFSDTDILLEYANYQMTKINYADIQNEGPWRVYKTPAQEFELRSSDEKKFDFSPQRPAIFISLTGGAELKGESSQLKLAEGEIAFIEAGEGGVSVEQQGVSYLAS